MPRLRRVIVPTIVIAFMIPIRVLAQATVPADDERFTAPPGQESDSMRALIDQARAGLAAGASVNMIIGDAEFVKAHEYPRFRQLIRDNARESVAVLVTPDEPGDRLIVRWSLGSEILFADDPRLASPEAQSRARRDGFVVAPVTRDSDGVQHVAANLRAN